jgi:hydrogenase maturation protease
MRTQIIGCGNRDRMDDAAGVLVGERLPEMGFAAEIQSGNAFELIASWEGQEHVILIDAVVTGAPCGTVHVWEGNPPRLPRTLQISSHGFGLAEALRLGQVLNCLPDRITVYGIEGSEFGIGETVSPEVLTAVERVAQQIAQDYSTEKLRGAEGRKSYSIRRFATEDSLSDG